MGPLRTEWACGNRGVGIGLMGRYFEEELRSAVQPGHDGRQAADARDVAGGSQPHPLP